MVHGEGELSDPRSDPRELGCLVGSLLSPFVVDHRLANSNILSAPWRDMEEGGEGRGLGVASRLKDTNLLEAHMRRRDVLRFEGCRGLCA